MSLAAGTLIGHYEILGSLGAGGMGEVYRAVDQTLGRDVALKILPAAVANNPGNIERFQREARAVAALNHPHIVTIYSVEQSEGVHFLTMEVVEGASLDRQISSTGLAVDALLTMAAQLADALAAAHDKGIVHRDLKPANVMVTASGRVKILDFGLAKIGDSAPRATEMETLAHTAQGVVLGTMPYMSPEQLEGLPVDARTDIFSLGVMLHEMATGTRPFQGASQAALLSSILRDQPVSVNAQRPTLPGELGTLITRCLEKDRERRVQTAKELRDALEALRVGRIGGRDARRPEGTQTRDKRFIVVLPFANLSPDAANEYLGDGLTEEIITDLSKVRALSVISRTSSMQLKGAKKDARTLGRELGVQYVLDGSVRKSGSSLRITAQLIDAEADTQLWSEKYSGTMDDVFEVQERVSREIVRALDITLTLDEHQRLAERPIADARAFELFLQARQEIRRYAYDRAAALVREAVQIEGETPPLMALLTWTKLLQVRLGVSDRQLLDEVDREARQLLIRVPDASYGHSLLGHIEYERGRMPQAAHHLKLAAEREPNDSDSMLMLVITCVQTGQNGLAQEAARGMMAIDPLSALSWMAAGVPQWFVGRAEQVIPALQRGLEIDPQNFIINWCIGYAYALLGRLSDALRHANALHDLGPDVPYTRQLLAMIDGLEGRRESALKRIAALDVARLDHHHLFHLGESFILAGDHSRGLDLVEQALPGFHPHLYMAEYCRFLDPVRETARFQAILASARELVETFEQKEAALNDPSEVH